MGILTISNDSFRNVQHKYTEHTRDAALQPANAVQDMQ